MSFTNSESNFAMTAATTTFDSIVQLIQSSNLNFKLQLSPFAANISLKKTPVKDRFGIPIAPQTVIPDCVNVAAIVTKNIELENELLEAKKKYAVAKDDCEVARDMLSAMKIKPEKREDPELLENKYLVNKHYEEVANLMKENEQLKGIIDNKND